MLYQMALMNEEIAEQSSKMHSQPREDCSFCKKIENAKKNKTQLYALNLSHFVAKPQFENLIHKDCECGRLSVNPSKDFPNLKVLVAQSIKPFKHIEYNACGCKIDTNLSLCQRMNPFNCCGKCSKAIEKEKAIQERDMTKPFAIVLECSCHFKETVEPVQPVISVEAEQGTATD